MLTHAGRRRKNMPPTLKQVVAKKNGNCDDFKILRYCKNAKSQTLLYLDSSYEFFPFMKH